MIEQVALFENEPEDLDCKTTLENIIVTVSAKWKVLLPICHLVRENLYT